jgi:hypothetical protein
MFTGPSTPRAKFRDLPVPLHGCSHMGVPVILSRQWPLRRRDYNLHEHTARVKGYPRKSSGRRRSGR